MMRSPSIPKPWGQPRPLHKYLHRYWDANRQDWHYVYPEIPGGVGGGSAESGDDEGPARHVAGQEYQWRKEQALAQDMDEQADVMANPPEAAEPKADNDEKKAYLEGFEEGYDLGRDVGKKVGEKE